MNGPTGPALDPRYLSGMGVGPGATLLNQGPLQPPRTFDETYMRHQFSTYLVPNPWVGGWTVPSMRRAIEQHDEGFFYFSSTASYAATRFAPIYAAMRQRTKPPRSIPHRINGGQLGLGRILREEAEAQFGPSATAWPDSLDADIYDGLAMMGFAVIQHTLVPSADASTLDMVSSIWPTSAVRWIPWRRVYQAMTLEGPVDIVDGDGKWSIAGDGLVPHLNGAIRCVGLEFLRGMYGERDEASLSDAYGKPKPIINLPKGASLESQEGKDTIATAKMLGDPASGAVFMHDTQSKMLEASAATSKLFTQILGSVWMYVAAALTGSDGTMGKGTGGVYISPGFFQTKDELVRGDVAVCSRVKNFGHLRPWKTVNYGSDPETPVYEALYPDRERDARTDSRAKRQLQFQQIVTQAKANGFDVDDDFCAKEAADLDLPTPPKLKAKAPPPALPPGAPNPAQGQEGQGVDVPGQADVDKPASPEQLAKPGLGTGTPKSEKEAEAPPKGPPPTP